MKKLYFIVGILSLIALSASIIGCAKPTEKILLIFSYHPEFSWVAEETSGVEDVLADKGFQIEKFYLDTKRNTSDEWMEKVAEEAVQKIGEFNPDIVIVFDDNACELVAKRYIGTSLPFVFCGMNAEPEDYGFPAQNITGVIERSNPSAAISLLQELVPDVEQLVLITDNSTTSQAFIKNLEETELPIPISEFYATDDFDAWKAKVTEFQASADAIGICLYHTVKDKGAEVSMPSEDVMGWTVENSQLPEFSFFDFAVNDGALCGVSTSGYEQGKAAAEIATRILNGEKPADISIECPQKEILLVNETRANELNIEIPEEILDEVELLP